MKVTRRNFLKLAGGAVLGGSVTAVTGYAYAAEIEPKWLVVEQVEIPITGLPPSLAGFKIVQSMIVGAESLI